MTRRTRHTACWLLILLIVLLSGCREIPIVGELDDNAPVALICFETLDDGVSGVVYRRVNRFEALIGGSEKPLLVAFYRHGDEINTRIIPVLEQMADDYGNVCPSSGLTPPGKKTSPCRSVSRGCRSLQWWKAHP
jgi:hypothetical protein